MIPARSHALAGVGALALAVLALPAVAQPNQVSTLNVNKAPTTLTVRIVGKDRATVRHEIRVAAHTVCRNAVMNGELSNFTLGWCSDTAQWKAIRRYEAIVRQQGLASSGEIVLAAG